MTGSLLVAGATSDAGKSVVTTAICRLLARRGMRVAPFKAQNMSNNSMVVAGRDGLGAEIGRAQWIQAVAAGAKFIVTPGFSPTVVRRCQEVGVPIFPGIATGTEIQMALDAGLEKVKFFPAEQLGGAKMVKALAAPYRSVKFIPTGGVTTANLAEYLALPAVLAVGGTWMVAALRVCERHRRSRARE